MSRILETPALDDLSFAELILETKKEYEEIMPEWAAMKKVCEQFMITKERARELINKLGEPNV